MSTVNTGQPGDPPAAAPDPTPAPQPLPTPPPDPAGDDAMVSIPLAQLPEAFRTGDWHNLVNAAKSYGEVEAYAEFAREAEKVGLTPEMLFAAHTGEAAPPPGQPPAQPYGVPPLAPDSERRLTELRTQLAAMQQVMQQIPQQMKASLTEFSETERDKYERQQRETENQRSLQEAAVKAVEGMGYKLYDEQGQANQAAHMVYREFLHTLGESRASAMPPDLSNDQQTAYHQQPYSTDEFAKANETLKWVNDLKFDMAGQVATEQANTPVSAGAGPSAGAPPKGWIDMTEAEREAAATSVPAPPDEELAGWGQPSEG